MILAELWLWIAGVALAVYVLREVWLGWRARRLAARIQILRGLLDGSDPEARAFAALRRRPSTWRDLRALEHLLEERRAALAADAPPEAVRALYESYDRLGIVDRYVRKLDHARGWAERAFAARFLGEIGSARAVLPLVRVLRNTREEDRDVRMAAGRALGRIRDPRAIAPLIEALDAPESWLPARVAEVLLEFGDAAFQPLVELLGGRGSAGVARAWAAQILGDLGNGKAVPVLLGCLGDLDDQVRARAAAALGKLADRRAVPELIRVMLGDPVPYVRIQVVRALGQLGDPRAMHYLIDALKDGEWWVRIRVVEALEQLGEQAVEPLFLALEDSDTEVRARAAMTLERLGVLDRLVEKLAEVDAGAREKLLAAGQAGVVEILIGALDHEDARIRFVVAEILGEVRNPAVSAALIGRFGRETDGRIRVALVRSLAQLQESSAAMPIAKLLGDVDERIRVEAVRALERIQVQDPHLLLDGAARDPEPRVRAGAAIVLGKVADERAVPLLLALLADAEPGVRAEAARALGLLRAESALGSLLEAFHDAAPAVQVAAARALGQVGSPRCLQALVRGLENASQELGNAIAWALGQIRWDDPERLIDVLFQGNDQSSRLGALAALAQVEHEAARELMRSMLLDADETVVGETVRLLGMRRDRAALPDLVALLASPTETTRLAVLEALCRVGDPAALPAIRKTLFDPSPAVRGRAVLALGYLEDREAADLLRGILAGERSTAEMRAHALLGLMVLGRDGDLEEILAALEEITLYDFLHERERLGDPILRAMVERVRDSGCVEYTVASLQSRAELEAALLRDLSTAHSRQRRVRIIRTLAFLRSHDAYPAVWRAFYKDPCEEVRVAALQFLAAAAPPEEFFRLLVDGLADLQPRVRAAALLRLRDVPVERALPLVIAQLRSGDPEVRDVLVEYLGDLADDRFERFLDGVLGTELDVRAREVLVRVLGRTRHRDAPRLLEAYLAEDEPELRRAAIETLSHVPGRRAAELVGACLEDPDVAVRLGAVDAAAGMGAVAGTPLLERALVDPAAEVRRRAILRFARVAPRAALDDLRAATRDAEPRVRAAALAALAVAGSEPVEEWVGPRDVPAVAEALRELGPAEELERRLASARPEEERIGALRALFFRDARLRQQSLAQARLDPSPRVQAAGRRLEDALRSWLAGDPGAAMHLGQGPVPGTAGKDAASDGSDAQETAAAGAGVLVGREGLARRGAAARSPRPGGTP
jgi:HEAT repeat protein